MLDTHWATGIYYQDLELDNEALIKAIYERRREDNYPAGYTSYYDYPRLEGEPFDSLIDALMAAAREYGQGAKGRLELDKIWFSIMRKGGTHPVHAHPGSYISGTYYPRSLGAIAFHDPRPGCVCSTITRDPIIRYPAVAGRVILFPSWLLHEVPVHTEDEERLSISFNIHLRT